MPFVLASAVTEIALDNSEKARSIYREAVEVWSRKECQEALNEVRITRSDIAGAIEAVQTDRIEGYCDPLESIYEKYRDSVDFKQLISRIGEFIEVGSNQEGRLRVILSQEHWLFFAVFVKTLMDFAKGKPDFEKNRVVQIADDIYDPVTFMSGTSRNRSHRYRVSLYKKFGWRLRNDRKVMKSALRWYQCRVIYSGIEEFCNVMADSGKILDPKNIDKEIRGFDEATGYLKRRRDKPTK